MNPIIDCDIHPYDSEEFPLTEFVPKEYRLALQQGLGGRPTHGFSNPFGLIRRDAHAQSPAQLIEQHLDRYGITFGILQPPGLGVSLINSIEVGNALARAWNEWQAEFWLAADSRMLGSICVNLQDPIAASQEIRRAAKNNQFVQVVIPGESRELYGHRQYYPVYETCVELGLPVALHPGMEGVLGSATPVGHPSNYFEWHSVIPLTFQSHLVSLVSEGVLERFPSLRFVLVEGGVSWLPPLLWRMDKNFKALRSIVPWLKRKPSEYVLEHFRLTTQPIEEPAEKSHLIQAFEMVSADRTLMFSSDFPHWDFDDPRRALPAGLDAEVKAKILWQNARDLYGLTV